MLFIKQYQIGWGQSVTIKGAQGMFQRSWFILMATGLISLGVAQFMRYLFDNKYRPGWTLRYGDKILYVFAVFVVWRVVAMVILYFSRTDIADLAMWLLNVIPMLLLNIAKILALLGLAQIMKRIMPMIEESKTLV